MPNFKPFIPKTEDITSSDAFKDAVESNFGQRFNDFSDEDWEELLRQYHEKMFPHYIVSIICVSNATLADLRFKIEDTEITYRDTTDQEFFKQKKRRMKPKPLG